MNTINWIELLVIVGCLLVAAWASGTETALSSVSRIRVKLLAEEGSREANVLHRLQQEPNRFLSAVLITNTVAIIVASVVTTVLAAQLAGRREGFWATAALTLLLAIIILFFAEVTPKTLAIHRADRWAILMAAPVTVLTRVLGPLIWLLGTLSRTMVRSGKLQPSVFYLSEDELKTLLNVSEEAGVIEEEERQMIHGVIEIGDTLVREVMRPRTDVVAVEIGASLKEVTNVIQRSGHTRLPVYAKDLDHIVGLVHAKDLLRLHSAGNRPFELEKLLRPVLYAPETKKVDELLHEMQQKKVHMMVVVDEYGGTAGVVTIEDILEEIVGEIRDEYDLEETEPLQVVGDHEVVVHGRHPFEELNEVLGLGIEANEDYDSVGGYVFSRLGVIPSSGTSFDVSGTHWVVEEVTGNRIMSVRITNSQPWSAHTLELLGMGQQDAADGLGGDLGGVELSN